ncbi:hypothetical protein C451_20315 [Halococcus thailandensis JCM 13552]|uniref:Uncharacterized protein n=1 Tax=Halococcus thailandensis JCM 13552 TaxID=1227457 RepID=M0MUQ0_9EURY|nr:hypothetical protein C451_20315 [Halococcus thailandensis JCM 13552]
MHESASVTAGESDIELLNEVVLGESRTPRWIVVSSFFRRFMEYSGGPFELVVAKFGWSSRTRFIVERGVEAALFESVQPVVDGLMMPAVLLFDRLGRKTL